MRSDEERLASALQGRYALLRQLGAGATATVYLADDLRHERQVAIKVLKPDLTEILGPDRFLREIRTIANLQHPHILPLFDSGQAEGFLFYVMPYVAGESLRERLERERQLPVADIVAITRAVAMALDYAHRHGIVHRDIKPDNILLNDGQPLIADFGIALALRTAGGDRLTGTGLHLGTPSYMSPEQAAGEAKVDGRTDLYSLACVGYEMLTGEPPFTAPTVHAVIARILAENPVPVSRYRPNVPLHLAAVVAKGLEKLPADRFVSGAEMARALDDESFRWPHPAARRAGVPWRRLAAALAGAVVIASLGLWSLVSPVGEPHTNTAIRLAFPLPEDQILPADGMRSVLEISPDGRQLVYAGQRGREAQLYLRAVGDFQVNALAGTLGASEPFFSPDGEWIGFFAFGKLKKVRTTGGTPIEIADVSGVPYGGSWGENGRIYYSLGGSSLWSVNEAGGPTTELPLTLQGGGGQPTAGEAQPVPEPLKWPHLLPGGRYALAAVGWTDEQGRPNDAGIVGAIDLANGEFRPLFAGSRPRYVDTGHIVFDGGRQSVRFVPFRLERFQVTGSAQPLVDNALRSPGSGSNFTVSRTGVLAYPTGSFDRRLVIVDRNGRQTPIGGPPRGFRLPRVSPSGRYVAVTVDPQPPHIWIVDLERERATRLTSDGYNLFADWSPDGSRLSFTRVDVDTPGVYLAPWPQAGPIELVRSGETGAHWANADQLFLGWAGDLRLFDMRTGAETDFLVTPAHERQPTPSPDGNWVAFTSDATGVDEVYVVPFSRSTAPIPVSSGGGSDPQWSADGGELFFRNGNTIWAARVRTHPTFELLALEPLFSERYDFSSSLNWDVLPDGRFLMVEADPAVGREIRFVFNWLSRPSSPGRQTPH